MTSRQKLPGKGAWNTNVSEVCLKSHAARNMGPSSGRDLCAGMRKWMPSVVADILTGKPSFFFAGTVGGGSLSEIFNGYRRGKVPCHPLQGHQLLKSTGETGGCCQRAPLVETQWTCHSYTARSSASKKCSHCCGWWICRKHPAEPDRLYTQACWRVKPLWNRAAITRVWLTLTTGSQTWESRTTFCNVMAKLL